VKGPKPAVVFGKIGREGLCGSGNTGILVYWEEPGNIGPGVGGGGSLPVSPYFSYNLKFKCLYTFGYTVALSHEISFFAMVHSTL
jgi:hypothetical protein